MSDAPKPPRCDACKHADFLFGVHPSRCRHPSMTVSLSTGLMRGDMGRCGPEGRLYEAKEKRNAS